ncbi:unnamed protein product [Ascophyllum nodosum]
MRRVYPRVDYTQAPWTVRQPSQSIHTSWDVSSAVPYSLPLHGRRGKGMAESFSREKLSAGALRETILFSNCQHQRDVVNFISQILSTRHSLRNIRVFFCLHPTKRWPSSLTWT